MWLQVGTFDPTGWVAAAASFMKGSCDLQDGDLRVDVLARRQRATTEGMLKLGYRPFERDVAAVEDTASRMRAHGGARASRADDAS